jgi:hypothetical protein
MLKRPSEFSQSNIKELPTASDTLRSLQSFCNYQSSAVSNPLVSQRSNGSWPFRLYHSWRLEGSRIVED